MHTQCSLTNYENDDEGDDNSNNNNSRMCGSVCLDSLLYTVSHEAGVKACFGALLVLPFGLNGVHREAEINSIEIKFKCSRFAINHCD